MPHDCIDETLTMELMYCMKKAIREINRMLKKKEKA